MKIDSFTEQTDYDTNPYMVHVGQMAMRNPNFRTALWTGEYMQMTLMNIPVRGEIGSEIHEDTDQMIRVEQGIGLVTMGADKDNPDFMHIFMQGDAIFVPAGTWHNIVNAGRIPLRLTSIYAPPHHPRGTIHRTKEEAQKEE